MKKVLSFILAIITSTFLVACTSTTPVETNSEKTQKSTVQSIDDTLNNFDTEESKKSTTDASNTDADKNTNINVNDTNDNNSKAIISGTITAASLFSEGKAFVQINGNKGKTYCIDKNGYILFEIDKEISKNGNKLYSRFINGYACIDGAICNTEGNLTYPEDLGVTGFYDIALNGGYILATKITSDFNSTKKELGIMNTKFEWVLEPSEKLFASIDSYDLISDRSYYSNGFIYLSKSKAYLNVLTGEISETTDVALENDPMYYYSNGAYYNINDESVVIDLKKYENIRRGTDFINGKAVIVFHNQSVSKCYYTVIDKSGTFLFEPAEINLKSAEYMGMDFDGENVLFFDYDISPEKVQCYDINGNFIGEMDLSSFGSSNKTFHPAISNGVIELWSSGGYYGSPEFYHFNLNFTKLY